MDWNSKEGRTLLWAAYPAGFLEVRGVFTVGGWLYTGVDQRWLYPDAGGAPSGRKHAPSHAIFEQYRLHGDLLPLPDPNDPATWAALLNDVWAAVTQAQPKDKVAFAPHNLVWWSEPSEGGPEWHLGTVTFADDPYPIALSICAFGPFACAGAEALIRARIQLREA